MVFNVGRRFTYAVLGSDEKTPGHLVVAPRLRISLSRKAFRGLKLENLTRLSGTRWFRLALNGRSSDNWMEGACWALFEAVTNVHLNLT